MDSPLVFDSYYSSKGGSAIPKFQDIHVTKTHILSSGKKQVVFRGHDKNNPLKIYLDNVISDVKLNVQASNAEIYEGPGALTNIPIKADSSKNVKISGSPGRSSAIDCSRMFVPFPH